MRILFALAAVAVWLLASTASAQPIVTPDPGRYATELSNNMSVGGIAPLRALYVDMFDARSLPTNIEAALITYERAITNNRAVVARVVEDISLEDTYRSVYLYHYFGSTNWMFTRLDFVRIDPSGDWALSSATFGSEWSSVAMSATSGFRSRLDGRGG